MPPTVVTLTCPSCGSSLQIPSAVERFACGYCGTSLEVRREGGIVVLAMVLEQLGAIERGIGQVGQSVDRLQPGVTSTADELAIQRLDKEYEAIREHYDRIRPNSGPGIFLFIVGAMGILLFTTIISSAAPIYVVSSIVLVLVGLVFMWIPEGEAKRQRVLLDAEAIQNRQERARRLSQVRSRPE